MVRRRGHPAVTKTFSKVALAKVWMREIEYSLECQAVVPGAFNVGALLDRYARETADVQGWSRTRRAHCRMLARQFKGTTLAGLDGARLVEWAKGMSVSPGSRARYLSLLAGAFHAAESLWGTSVPWESFRRARRALARLGLVGRAGSREVRVDDAALQAIKAASRSTLPLSDIVDFAVWTGLRASEVCRVLWADIDTEKRLLLVRDRKAPRHQKGNHTWVPLLGAAWGILERQPRACERIWPFNPESLCTAFSRAAKRAGRPDVSFHALRHECASRLFEAGLSIPEVALVTGHRDWASLRRYTNLRPESLHKKLQA